MGLFSGKKRKRRPARKRSAAKTRRNPASAATRHRSRKVKARATRRRKTARRRWFTAARISFLMATGFSMLILGLMALAYFMHDLPDVSTLMDVKKVPSIVVRTVDGEVIGSSGDLYGEYMRYNDIPRDLIKAVIATEDRNFFRHFGVDPFGLLRAAVANFRAGRIVQGGSTITQQLAKNIFLTPERTLKRKIQEVLLALWMESRYSKQQIITVYLNRVYFGAGTYGIDAASRRYFGKSARALLLPESAMIAGLLKAPSRYAPTNNPELAIGRATQVLINMEDAGLINKGQVEAAKVMYKTIEFAERQSTRGSRYFVDWVLDQIPAYVGGIEADLLVTTTFDPAIQRAAEAAVEQVMTEAVMQKRDAHQVAVVSMTPDGAVKAMVGGRDYSKSQYNRAVQARRQPGSAFKLFVYLAALEKAGYAPISPVYDAPIEVDGWRPGNYSGRHEGEMQLREAFAESVNSVAVRVSEEVGRQNVIDMAYRLGLKADMQPVPSLALGVTETTPLEMTGAYAHLAAGGRIVLPFAIETIKDAYGTLFYQRSNASLGRVLQPGTVAQMNDMLLAVVEDGTGRGAAIGRPAAGKTGTSQDFRDAWFVGFTPELVTGVWVGNDNASPMDGVTGGNLPAQIWREHMQAALVGRPASTIRRDSGSRLQPRRIIRNIGDAGRNFWNRIFDNEPDEPDTPAPIIRR